MKRVSVAKIRYDENVHIIKHLALQITRQNYKNYYTQHPTQED